MNVHTCNNCQKLFTGKYCNNCGQDAHVGKLDMHGLLHEAWHGLTHTDKGVLKLIRDLAVQPGKTYHEYFTGARKKYFSPVVFFLLNFAILLVINKWVFDFEDYRFNTLNEFDRYYQQAVKFKAFILLPVQVLITWLFFFRRHNLAQVTVFWLYCIGFINVIAIVLSVFRFAFVGSHKQIEIVILWVQYLFVFIHLLLVFGNNRVNKVLCITTISILVIADAYASFYTINQVGIPTPYPSVWGALKEIFSF